VTINKKHDYSAILKKDTVYISALQESLPISQSRKMACTADHEQKRPVNLGNYVDEAGRFQYLQIIDQPLGENEIGGK